MKPGKPLTVATVEPGSWKEGIPSKKKIVIALPGNPVSSFVCFHLFAAPVIRSLLRLKNPNYPIITVMTTMPLKPDPERREYHRAILKVSLSPPSARYNSLLLPDGAQSGHFLVNRKKKF